jgi:hypothetical protein
LPRPCGVTALPTNRRADRWRAPPVGQAALAQLVEHIIRNDGVVGSSPSSGTTFVSVRGRSWLLESRKSATNPNEGLAHARLRPPETDSPRGLRRGLVQIRHAEAPPWPLTTAPYARRRPARSLGSWLTRKVSAHHLGILIDALYVLGEFREI